MHGNITTQNSSGHNTSILNKTVRKVLRRLEVQSDCRIKTSELFLRYYYTDSDVADDPELKNFANELSADGSGVNGGIGMVR